MLSRTLKLLKLFLILLIPVLIITAAVRLLATDQYLAFEYGKESFPSDPFGFTQQQRFELASFNIHYVRGHLADSALSNSFHPAGVDRIYSLANRRETGPWRSDSCRRTIDVWIHSDDWFAGSVCLAILV